MFRIVKMLTLTTILIAPASAFARHDHQHAQHDHTPTQAAPEAPSAGVPAVAPHQVIVDVHGVVCSICAYGLEKRLSKLPFLDRTQFKNGVLTDIYRHQVTLAVQPAKPADLTHIYRMIKDGGYTPVRFFLQASGTLHREGDRYLLTTPALTQPLALTGKGVDERVENAAVSAQVDVEAGTVSSAAEDQPIPAAVVAWEGQS